MDVRERSVQPSGMLDELRERPSQVAFPEGNHPPETVGTSQCSNSVLDTVTLLTSQRRLR